MMLTRSIVVFALFVAIQAHQMTKRLITDGGPYCAELKCFHPSSKAGPAQDVPLSSVVTLSLEFMNEAHSFSNSFFVNRDGSIDMTQEVPGVHDIQVISNDNTFEYSVKVSDTYLCESVEPQFSCYLDYMDDTGSLMFEHVESELLGAGGATGGDDVGTGGSAGIDFPPVQPGYPDKEIELADAVIEVMSTLANDMAKFGWSMDGGIAHIDGRVLTLAAHTNKSVQDTEDRITTELNILNQNSVDVTARNEEGIRQADLAVGVNMAQASTQLLDSLTSFQSDVDVSLSTEQAKFLGLVEDLNTNVSNKIENRNAGDKNLTDDLQGQVDANLKALGDNIASYNDDTSERFKNTSSSSTAEFAAIELHTGNNFDTIEATSSANKYDLETDFSSWVTDFTDSFQGALSNSGASVDANSEDVSAAVDLQINATSSVVFDATVRLSESVQRSANSLVSSVDQASSNLKNSLNAAQNLNAAEIKALTTKITAQTKNKNTQINAAQNLVTTLVTESANAYASYDSDLNAAFTYSINRVQDSLNTGRDTVKASANDLQTAVKDDLIAARDSLSESLSGASSELITRSAVVSTEFIAGIQKLGSDNLFSAEENFNTTTTSIETAEVSSIDTTQAFSASFEQQLSTFEKSSSDGLSGVRNGVNQDIDGVDSSVSELDKTTAQKVASLSTSVAAQTQAGSDSLSQSITELTSNTNTRLDTLNQVIGDSVAGLGSELESSVSTFESESLSKLTTLKTDAESRFSELQQQSKNLNGQVKSLGSEISTEQGQVTGLGDKFTSLSQTLGVIDTHVDTFSDELVKFSGEDKQHFEEANRLLNEKSGETFGLLSGVDARIGRMTNKVETSIISLQGLMGELDQDIKVIGTNLSTFLNTEISEITGDLRDNTDTLTRYLQPRTCEKAMDYSTVSNNRYVIISPNEENENTFDILCDTATNGGGWVVIQRRSENDVAFYKNWQTYKEGFGTLEGDFYIGNERIHELTSKHKYEIRVTVVYESQEYFAHYDSFSIGSEADMYKLSVGKYSGTAGDSLTYHNGMKFSTYDRDNDLSRRTSCARASFGAWWYKDCHYANLNGRWKDLRWYTLTGTGSASTTEMKIRRID